MGSVNLTTVKKSKWRIESFDDFSSATTMMTEPFTINSLYPKREVERPKGSGKYVEVQQAMQHQELFHRKLTPSGKTPKYILCNGGVGSGKSVMMCVEILWLLRTYPGIIIVVIAAYDYYFDEFFMPTLAQVLDDIEENPIIKSYSKKSRTYNLTNGSSLRCKAYDDSERIKGWQAHCIFITEAGLLGDRFNQKARGIYNAALERMRAPGRNFPRRVYLDQNPEGHNWTWELFIRPNKLGDEGKLTLIEPNDWYPDGAEYREYEHTTPGGDTYYCISTGTALNPFNPPGYLESLIDSRLDDPAMMSRKVGGNFTPVHALVYDRYCKPETHIIPIEKILAYWSDYIDRDQDGYCGVDCLPRDWRVYVGIDVAGASSPWAIEIYIETPEDENGIQHYLAIDELYVKGYTWPVLAEMILAMTEGKGFTEVSYWIDPHSGNQKHGANQTSVVMEFKDFGINCNIPRSYTKIPAIKRVQEFLRCEHNHPHPYLTDDIVNDPEDVNDGKWRVGASALYYVSSPDQVDEKRADVLGSKDNPTGVINWYNLKEKEVYRYDSTKERQTKENEEGLAKVGPEKLIDRDDHAQTAEMFAFLGIRPIPRTGVGKARRHLPDKSTQSYEADRSRTIMYRKQ